MSVNPCHCEPVREALSELEHRVETWARVEQPDPRHVDLLTSDATTRIRLAALAASALRSTEEER